MKELSKSIEKEPTDFFHDFTAVEWTVNTNITAKTMEIDHMGDKPDRIFYYL